ncbi:MAG: asparaginase [Oligoflexia bacterium]|nr:asparaginase [Oligoflexia bacterium]
MKKRILILHTGGTIGMISANGNRFLKPGLTGRHFIEIVPELNQLARVKTQVIAQLDSSNVLPHHWVRWLKSLKESYDDYDGFVITHGTDTMAYSASAFSFALGRTNKPVIFTGSQRPLGHLRTDGPENLINAVSLACDGPPEVSLCFGNQLLRANRSTKFSASDFVAFESFNFPPLAKMGVEVEPFWQSLGKSQRVRPGRPRWLCDFDSRVFSMKVFPGLSKEMLIPVIESPQCHGLVIEAYGSGTVPTRDSTMTEALILAKRLSKPVVVVSQCPHGRIDLDVYETSLPVRKYGALSAGDMTREASVVKLMHGLGLGLRGSALAKYFTSNRCGERSN